MGEVIVRCGNCDTVLKNRDVYCYKCGYKVIYPPMKSEVEMSVVQRVDPITLSPPIPYYKGEFHELKFFNHSWQVSTSGDAYNFYRKAFKTMAVEQADALKADFLENITTIDTFLSGFVSMYMKHRKRLIDNAMDILFQAEIFDVSREKFEQMHTRNYCLCSEDMDTMVKSFNLTIKANQERKIRTYNMLPGVIFGGGIGGLLAATATNYAISSIAEADIRNANVTSKQRIELFRRIDPQVLANRAYIDYWNVWQTLTWWLNQRERGVWFPNQGDKERAEGLFQNLRAGRVPQEKELESFVKILQINPYNEDYFKYMLWKYGRTEEAEAICDYFGYSVNRLMR